MALSLTKEVLLEALQKAYPIIPLKSSLQILANFRMVFDESRLVISATDLDQSMRVSVEAKGKESFDVTVNAKKLFEIIRELPDGGVSISIEENVLIVETERDFSCKIAGADSNDFPGIPEIKNGTEFEIPSLLIKSLFLKSGFAVAKDESRACLAGILWEIHSDGIGMVATDGHRLGSSFIKHMTGVKENMSVIVSPKSLSHLVRILDAKNAEEKISVAIGEKYCSFSTPLFTMYSKLVEGPYPDYGKVIPKNNPKEVVIERADLMSAVKRVSVLSNQKTHLVKFVFSSEKLDVMVVNKEIGGEAKERITVEYAGENHQIGFNGQYFNEILDIVKTPKILLKMNTQISACLILPVHAKDEEALSEDVFLIMPLRIMES